MPDSEQPTSAKVVKNIVLVGRSGNGKSATGNSLIGQNVFTPVAQARGVTTTCETSRAEKPGGLIINVIDTPGMSDLSRSAEFISKEIIKCLTLAEEGLHVVVLVLSVKNRITEEEESILGTLRVLFGSEIVKYLIVLFTGGDELEAHDLTLDKYFLQGCPEFLTRVLNECGNRKVLFDNKTTDEGKKLAQFKQFLALATDIENINGGKPFTNDMHLKIREEAERLKQQQKEVEAKNLEKAALEKLKKDLQDSHDQNIIEMQKMLEVKFQQASEEMVLILSEIRRENNESHRSQDVQENRRRIIQAGLAVPAIIGTGLGLPCNIL